MVPPLGLGTVALGMSVFCLLQLSPVYSGKTCGLCGNYNGNKGDDFLTPAGLVEPLVVDFGNAWKLQGDCPDLHMQHSDPCSLNPRLSMRAQEPWGLPWSRHSMGQYTLGEAETQLTQLVF